MRVSDEETSLTLCDWVAQLGIGAFHRSGVCVCARRGQGQGRKHPLGVSRVLGDPVYTRKSH